MRLISNRRLVKIGKYLSKYLRHSPEEIGLNIDTKGWVKVTELLLAVNKHDFYFSKSELIEVVKYDDKQRFAFNEDLSKIRANQGHSIPIDLDLPPQIPPTILYHGTNERFLESIQTKGLRKMSRHHVHLSSEIKTAKIVGKRRGKPVIFAVNGELMHQEGYPFFCTQNGIWLVDSVPIEYLSLISEV